MHSVLELWTQTRESKDSLVQAGLAVGCPRLHLNKVTKLPICPIELHRVKINPKKIDVIWLRDRWFWLYGAQLGKWAALSLYLGVIWDTLTRGSDGPLHATRVTHQNTSCFQSWYPQVQGRRVHESKKLDSFQHAPVDSVFAKKHTNVLGNNVTSKIEEILFIAIWMSS